MSDDQWKGRTVMVTGAAGFLGGWVSERLVDKGADVVGLDIAWGRGGPSDARVRRVDGDVRDADSVRSLLATHVVDTVIHLAAQAVVGVADRDPVGTFDHNVRGSWALLEACRAAPSVDAVVVASSDKAYGDHGGVPYDEGMELRALQPYAVSKACADMLARTYARRYGLPVAVTRCANLYGAGDLHWSRVVPGSIRSILREEPPVIRSDGTPVRDFLHASDAADGMLAVAAAVRERPSLTGSAFNLSAEEPLPVIDIVRRLLIHAGSDLQPVVLAEGVEAIPEQRVGAKRARETLAWAPRIRLDDGLPATLAAYRDYFQGGS